MNKKKLVDNLVKLDKILDDSTKADLKAEESTGPRYTDGYKFVNAFNMIPKSKVSIGAGGAMELAYNQCAIESLLSAFDKATEPPEEYAEYEKKLQEINLEEVAKVDGAVTNGYYPPYNDSQRAKKRIDALKAEYATTISTFEKRMATRAKGLQKPLGIKLNMIPKSEISIEAKDPKAAFIISGLYICIAKDKA
jgi:hypothetical protein